MPKVPQLDLLSPEHIWQDSLLSKTRGLLDPRVWENLDRCGRDECYKTCRDCGTWSTFYYQCSMKFCPLCNWRIARRRAEMLRMWSLTIRQPKHVVLTARNSETITREKLRWFGQCFAKFRRTKCWKKVRGGCISTEITNEGRGWHIHAHILVDVHWLDAAELAIEWGRAVGQDYAIVKVKDCRGKEYLGEITKYVVKGAELVSWTPEDIAAFIAAIRGVRFFRTFGTLFKIAREIKEIIDGERPPAKPCKCGCEDFTFQSDTSSVIHQIRSEEKRRGRR
jgi:hypothetical protein